MEKNYSPEQIKGFMAKHLAAAHRMAYKGRTNFGLGAVAMFFEQDGRRLLANIRYLDLTELESELDSHPEHQILVKAIREHSTDSSYVLCVKYADTVAEINVVHTDAVFLPIID